MNEKEMVVRDKQEATKEEPTRPGRAYQPEVDIYETPEGLWLWADMPGADEKQVSVELVDGVLEIEIPKREEAKPRQIQINVGKQIEK